MLGFIVGAIVAGIAFLVTAQVLPAITVCDDLPALVDPGELQAVFR